MKTEPKSLVNYQLRGTPIVNVPVPVVGNLIFDELGQAVLALHNERFKGVKDIEDTTNYKSNQPIAYSNTPRALSYNTILQEETNRSIKVLTPEQVIQYWDAIPDKPSTYADTNAIIIYPHVGPNEDLRQIVLGIIGKKDIKVPLLVSGLGVEKADNKYGFTFGGTDYVQVTKAPYAAADGKVRYNEQGLIRSDEGISIWTPGDQSGLRRVHRSWDDILNLRYDRLLGSNEYGRVQVIQDPQGRAQNLEGRVRELQVERERQKAEIDDRYEMALRVLKTGIA